MTNSNNFSQNGALFCLKEGLAMGTPSSAVPSEISMQHTESIWLKYIANKILGYFRFVDDVLIIYNYAVTHKLGSRCT